MKIAYFDCFAGVAGDMVLGAMLDCGVPIDALRRGLASLPVEEWTLGSEAVLKQGIHGIKVTVAVGGRSDADEAVQHQAHHQAHQQNEHPARHEPLPQLAAAAAFGDFDEAFERSGEPATPAAVPQQARATENANGAPHRHPSTGAEHSHDGHDHSHHDHDHDHAHAHEHGHDHHHDHEHDHSGAAPAAHHHGRSMAEIRAIIEASALSVRVKAQSLAIFERIAVVEAEMHHSTPEDIHFHEIGGIDSLVDICGAAWCLEYLGIDAVYCSALPYFSGMVQCAHGQMPLPAPATLKLLEGAPLLPTAIVGEMITPTGAAIVSTLARGYGAPPAFTVEKSGCGAGSKNWPDRPNLLRVVIGEDGATCSAGLQWETLDLLETNIDDMNPEFFALVFDRLFEAGAVDVWLAPVQMKKNRPAAVLAVLCPPAVREAVMAVVLRETTTLGVRISPLQRVAMRREHQTVKTPYGPVAIKVALWREGGVERAVPEYESVASAARTHGVSAREVYLAAWRAFSGKSADMPN